MKLTLLNVLGAVALSIMIVLTLRPAILASASGVSRITPDLAQKLLSEKKAILVDVREKDEVAAGMLKGALWIPLSGLQSGDAQTLKTLDSIQKEVEIIAYCRSGARSSRAGALLIEKGYRVKNLGGYAAAKAAGMPTQ